MKRGDIYYIANSKAVGAEIAKSRPAVIVSANVLNATSEAVEVVYLTTQPKREMHTHAVIYATGRPSTALCEQVSTVARSRVGDFIGRCSDEEMDIIDLAILESLGLTAPETEQIDPVGLPLSQDTVDFESVLIRLEAERDIYKELYESLLYKAVGEK